MEQTLSRPQTTAQSDTLGGIDWRHHLASLPSYLMIGWNKARAWFSNVAGRFPIRFAAPLDVERISARLAVAQRADDDARRDIPPSSEERPSGAQREIIAHFGNLRRQAHRKVSSTIAKAGKRLDKIELTDALAQIRDIPAGCEKRILRFLSENEPRLEIALEKEARQKRHYDAFREKNGLDRLAVYPRVLVQYHVLALLLMAATAAAIWALAGAGLGRSSGVSTTWILTVSAMAVALPFILGDFSIRAMNHVSGVNNFFGLAVTLVTMLLIFVMAYYVDFHLATVHAGSEMTSAGILDTMLVAPLDVISHVASWKAFSLVSLAGLLSMVFAYRSDDPYPGYGEVQRNYYRVRNAGLQVSSDFEKRINAMIDEGDAHTLQIAKRIKAGIRKYARLADKSQQMASSLDDYDEALEETCNLVLDRYRHINSSVRRSEPPVSFSEHVCYNPADDSELRRRADSGNRVAELQGRIAELEKEVGIARQGLRALNVRMASSIGDMTAAEASD